LRKRGVAHNGCFIAHDRGGGIRGARIDLFVGTRKTYYRTLGKNYPRSVRLYLNHPNCKHTT
jgi:3D (Asp-Asp-Asp) domain-containing protein